VAAAATTGAREPAGKRWRKESIGRWHWF